MSQNQHQLPKVADGLTSKRHRRATLWTIRRAVRNGWAINPRCYDELCRMTRKATKQASHEIDHRATIAGIWVFLEFSRHNLRVAVEMDKLERDRMYAEEQQRRENIVFGKIGFGGRQNEIPNGSHRSMEPIRIPSTTQSKF